MSLVKYLRENYPETKQAYFVSKEQRDYFINVVPVLTNIQCMEYTGGDEIESSVVITDVMSEAVMEELSERFSVIQITPEEEVQFIQKREGEELDLFEGEKFMREYLKSKKLYM
jgi:hypothetical protein